MRYIQSTILKNEKLIFWTRPHWIIFFPAVVSFLAALFFIYYGPRLGLIGLRLFNLEIYQLIALIAFLFGVYGCISGYITYQTSEYGITDRRVLMKTGWIRRNSLEIFLDKIEAVRVNQSILGRILNYGTIVIVGTGGTEDPFYSVPNPLEFRKRVQQQIDMYEHSQNR